ncbi:unnamed protein product [Rhizoctonia solani]|uniref:Uncharacterized protein n=1 Tax=Rhizoctonia solani TaxID=456999 RepID=A0A8H3DWE1_9AGAM|nr:unnamed protein product [Rhizoctonia solani]
MRRKFNYYSSLFHHCIALRNIYTIVDAEALRPKWRFKRSNMLNRRSGSASKMRSTDWFCGMQHLCRFFRRVLASLDATIFARLERARDDHDGRPLARLLEEDKFITMPL